MKKTFAAFVAVATIAGSLAATAASARRGVAAGVAAPGRYYVPAPYGAGPGPYDDFGSCEWVTQRFWDGHGWRVRRVRVCGSSAITARLNGLLATIDFERRPSK